MTSFRCLTAAGLLMFVGLCNGQEPSDRIPSLRVGTIENAGSESRNDAIRRQSALDSAEAGLFEAESHEISVDDTRHEDVCSCGSVKHCHGVCRDPGHPKKPKREKPGDVDRGDCPPLRYRIPDCRRAGNPHSVAKWAKCSVDGKYSAWFTGGGAAFFRGRHRQSREGTWGLDYDGLFGHANVWLKYTRDRVQGGEGKYETDGEPKLVSRAHSLLKLGH